MIVQAIRGGTAPGIIQGILSGIDALAGDGAAGAFAPASAAEFAALGIAAPSNLWQCQEASGNLADSIGSLTLTANATPTYQQSITGWARKALGFNETAAQRFQVTAGSGPNVATQSVAWLCYFLLSGTPGAQRRILTAADGLATTGVLATFLTTGRIRMACVNVTADGTYDYRDSALHPLLLVYNRTGSLVRVFTDKEQVNGTYSAGAVDAAKGLGAAGAGNSLPGFIAWAFAAAGATAEGYGKTTLQQLGWQLSY